MTSENTNPIFRNPLLCVCCSTPPVTAAATTGITPAQLTCFTVAVDPAQAFVDYLTALTAWRRLPLFRPGLPSEILPAEWNGMRAADTFFELQERLAKPAYEFVESIMYAS